MLAVPSGMQQMLFAKQQLLQRENRGQDTPQVPPALSLMLTTPDDNSLQAASEDKTAQLGFES